MSHTLKHSLTLSFILLVLFLLCVGPALAGHGEAQAPRKGILLVAFGSTVPEARASLDNIEQAVKKAYPDIPVVWAYSSNLVRERIAEQGLEVPSPAQALADMMDQGFTHVAVQSLHTIPGQEYNDMKQAVLAFSGMPKGLARVVVGDPLLCEAKDLHLAAQGILANLPKERTPDQAVVLMGHGTHHPGGVYYAAMQYYLRKLDPNVFMGTVEGEPTLDDVQNELRENKITTAYLLPFMAVAGDHAQNDMAGDEDDSWKSILQKQGVECVCVLKGTAENPDLVKLWVDHLGQALEELE